MALHSAALLEFPFADLYLARRLERAEGHECAVAAEARRKLMPESGAQWTAIGGAFVVFDGAESPVTQTFALGLSEPLTAETLDRIEAYYRERNSPVFHEVSPHAGVGAYQLLSDRNYRPVEISNVLVRRVAAPESGDMPPGVSVRVTGPEESEIWGSTAAKGWAQEAPHLHEFFRDLGRITTAREGTVCFLGETDGMPAAAAALGIHEGIALLAGASTIPEKRKRGLQSALMQARMRYAFEHGCDLASVVVAAGSNSQRNAERNGFRIAYTRTKWQLRG